MNLPFLLPKIDHDRVVQAILAAEAKTSGEIRVMVVRHKVQDPVAAAQAYFDKLGMASSPHRNSVLILVAPRSRRFAVIGDSGTHDKCGDAFWSSLAETMGGYFKDIPEDGRRRLGRCPERHRGGLGRVCKIDGLANRRLFLFRPFRNALSDPGLGIQAPRGHSEAASKIRWVSYG